MKAEDVVVLPYPGFGVKLYGNAIIVSEEFLERNPEGVKAFLRAFTKGMRDVIADPKASIATVKARDGIIDVALEERRLRLAPDATVLTPDARAEGFGMALGPRLSVMASQVSDAFGTKERVRAEAAWNGSLLPSATSSPWRRSECRAPRSFSESRRRTATSAPRCRGSSAAPNTPA